MTIQLSLDSQKFTSKPAPIDAAQISARIGGCKASVPFDTFVKALGAGQTYTPGIFKEGIRKASKWEGQQIFVADIDNGNRSLSDLNVDGFNLPVAIVHESFSSTENCRKWRLIFISNKLVTDPADALAILRMIQKYFDSDSCVVDLARLLYATTSDKIHAASETYFNYDSLDLEEYHAQVPRAASTTTFNLPDKSKTHRKSKYIMDIAIRKVLICRESRYQSVWQAARILTQCKYFSEAEIRNRIKFIAEESPNFDLDSWDKNIDDVISSAISWGKCHVWDEDEV